MVWCRQIRYGCLCLRFAIACFLLMTGPFYPTNDEAVFPNSIMQTIGPLEFRGPEWEIEFGHVAPTPRSCLLDQPFYFDYILNSRFF